MVQIPRPGVVVVVVVVVVILTVILLALVVVVVILIVIVVFVVVIVLRAGSEHTNATHRQPQPRCRRASGLCSSVRAQRVAAQAAALTS